jgi:hypothetical protein
LVGSRAASTGADATTTTEPVTDGRNTADDAVVRNVSAKGGKRRAAKLTPEQRSAIAKRAALTRWSKDK